MKKILHNFLFGLLFAFGAVSCNEPEVNEPQDNPTDNPSQEKVEVGKPITLDDFTLTLTALHAGDVFLSIEPENKEMTYWYSLQTILMIF